MKYTCINFELFSGVHYATHVTPDVFDQPGDMFRNLVEFARNAVPRGTIGACETKSAIMMRAYQDWAEIWFPTPEGTTFHLHHKMVYSIWTTKSGMYVSDIQLGLGYLLRHQAPGIRSLPDAWVEGALELAVPVGAFTQVSTAQSEAQRKIDAIIM